MREPFVSLCSQITRESAWTLAGWLRDDEVRKYLSDTEDVSGQIEQTLARANLPVLTHLFNKGSRFYMAFDKQDAPVGFVRLALKDKESEIVLVIGNRDNWGRRLGTSLLSESLKVAFFELRSVRVVAKIHKDNTRSLRIFTRAGFKLMEETAELKKFMLTMKDYLKHIQGKPALPGEIYITQVDKARLRRLVNGQPLGQEGTDEAFGALARELARARVVDASELTPNIITMRSKALLSLDGENVEALLVYPPEADWDKRRLSVLSPVGTAILGYGEGDHIEWDMPSGRTVIKIKKVLYQPEAAGDYHL